MTMRMLIDARHREETRVAVVKGNRIEEFDFESSEHKQLKGNIYLAKVTRVEPSLQAAFVDYGGNRHGFLAFSEIHPDYYQIPREDREALLREEAEHAAEEERLRASEEEHDGDDDDHDDDVQSHVGEPDDDDADAESAPPPSTSSGSGIDERAAESLRTKRMNLRRRYKIQDVIQRRQVILVQVVKEERGGKGAALTSYLSLAGRYCVLMPNTSHGGGISRKISNVTDRKRLKSIMADLNLPRTMGCIVRTAGLQRTKVEIRRDFDYLARLWDEIRETTLKSAAPALVYQDSDLIKRAIRDLYNRDIEEVVVEGEEGYLRAKAFMKMLMPSHARRVLPYVDTVPLFQRASVEEQLSAMYQPIVQLRSGGYIVINPTEALVSIDINSGRSTREYGIEATAVGTNLEAAHEIARQLRLRDMAGLVVIDFIDMENGSNVRKVEKAMKAALADDRARIQVGRISSFGLLEMSRQRLRTGVLEASTRQCPHCEGTGLVRTASSAGLSALRLLEDEAARGHGSQLSLRSSQEAAFYVLNRKRAELATIEARYGVQIEIVPDGEIEGARMTVEVGGPPPVRAPIAPRMAIIEPDDDVEDDYEDEEEIEAEEPRQASGRSSPPRDDSGEGGATGPRARRRRRRGRRGSREEGDTGSETVAADGLAADEAAPQADDAEISGETQPRSETGSRRGRRGGRRRRGRGEGAASLAEDAIATDDAPAEVIPDAEPIMDAEPEPKPKRTPRRAVPVADLISAEAVEAPTVDEPKPKRTRKAKATSADTDVPTQVIAPEAEIAPEAKPKRTRKPKAEAPTIAETTAATVEPTTEEAGGNRKGWWQRTFGAVE